jgi:hypothetical protein
MKLFFGGKGKLSDRVDDTRFWCAKTDKELDI